MGCQKKDKSSSWHLVGFCTHGGSIIRVNSIMSGRNPPLLLLYTYSILIYTLL